MPLTQSPLLKNKNYIDPFVWTLVAHLLLTACETVPGKPLPENQTVTQPEVSGEENLVENSPLLGSSQEDGLDQGTEPGGEMRLDSLGGLEGVGPRQTEVFHQYPQYPRPFPSLYADAGDDAQNPSVSQDTTLIPELQEGLRRYIKEQGARRAAVVLVSVKTGEVLAAVESEPGNGRGWRQLQAGSSRTLPEVVSPNWPAASLFKIVTTAASYEEALLGGPEVAESMNLTSGCSTDGPSGTWLSDRVVKVKKTKAQSHKSPRSSKRHRGRVTALRRHRQTAPVAIPIGRAFGHSCNAYFARLAVKNLGLPSLLHYASLFGWGEAGHSHLAADFRLPESPIVPPRQASLGRPGALGSQGAQGEGRGGEASAGRFGAGFGHVALSPMHAAWLSLMIASDGRPMPLRIFKASRLDPRMVRPQAALISEATTARLRQLMAYTVQDGTASGVYSRAAYQPLRDQVGGKTGTLNTFERDGVTTWFTGMMPLSAPEVVVAALVVENGRVRIKGKDLAAEALRLYAALKASGVVSKRRVTANTPHRIDTTNTTTYTTGR